MTTTINPRKDAEAALERLITARRRAINSLTRVAGQKTIEKLIQIQAAIEIVKAALNEEPSREYEDDNVDDLVPSGTDD
jgi:hypothetical protein